MRKIILIVILALSIFLCYTVVANGVELGENFKISNFKEVEDASKQVDTLISQLVNVNDIEYKSKQTSLETAIKAYKDAKEEYEDMASIIESNDDDEIDISMVDIYDVDFLWTVIGNYGTEEGIALKFDVTQSTSATSSSTDYTMCDLKFTVSGDYIPITEFIYHIEDDNKLGFEISDFEIAKGGDNLQATFTVKGVPINNANLTELQTSVDTNTTNTTNTIDPNGTMTDPNAGYTNFSSDTTTTNNTMDNNNTVNY